MFLECVIRSSTLTISLNLLMNRTILQEAKAWEKLWLHTKEEQATNIFTTK